MRGMGGSATRGMGVTSSCRVVLAECFMIMRRWVGVGHSFVTELCDSGSKGLQE